jgi:hypothetical protein
MIRAVFGVRIDSYLSYVVAAGAVKAIAGSARDVWALERGGLRQGVERLYNITSGSARLDRAPQTTAIRFINLPLSAYVESTLRHRGSSRTQHTSRACCPTFPANSTLVR